MAVAAAGLAACVWAEPLAAQTDVEELGRALGGARPPAAYYDMLARDPRAYQFSEANGWIRRARRLTAAREAQRARLTASSVAGAAPASVAGAVGGYIDMPVLLILYGNTDSLSIVQNLPRETMARRLYGTDPAPPYSVTSYYDELSSGAVQVVGTVFEWTRVSQPDTVYEGDAGCNGLSSGCGARIGLLIQEIVAAHDADVDFGQFDSDGPDGVPNSGDDDGFVDALVLLHPEVGGECKAVNSVAENSIWSHRWTYSNWTGTTLATDDPAATPGGGVIRINDYIIQGGQGGDSLPFPRGGCESLKPASMGVVAHETGHLFDLPDLYDTGGGTAGIGRWGLMGMGNQQVAYRPTHMEAWSRARLGWVTEVVLRADTTLEITPVETSDTAFVLPIANSNEYFLLENRQRIGSDSMIIAPGLLIFHVDSALVRARTTFNRVNASLPHGVSLEQGDGLNELQGTSGDRGDSGDPYPGQTGNRAFGPFSTPSSNRNDGGISYVSVDSIGYVGNTTTMRARVEFLNSTVIAAVDTMAEFRLDGEVRRVFDGLLLPSTPHDLAMDSVQVVNGRRNRYTWVSWSNGEPREHSFISSSSGDTIIADVAVEYLLEAAVVGEAGSVDASIPIDLSGTYLDTGTGVTLTAAPEAGYLFEGWSGDTTASASTLTLTMNRGYRLAARFAAPLLAGAEPVPGAVMGRLYQAQLSASGGTGSYQWSLVSGTLPAGLGISHSGVIAGLPTETGSFPFTARVVSGSQTVTRAYLLDVAAPALAVGDVVEHLVGRGQRLSNDDLNYLDLLGNDNGSFDVGDFLAWVESAGVTVSPEALRAVQATSDGRTP